MPLLYVHGMRLWLDDSGGGRAVGPIMDSACSCCGIRGCHWDRLGGLAVCPDCQEATVAGKRGTVRLPARLRPCAACGLRGLDEGPWAPELPAAGSTFVTFPLRGLAGHDGPALLAIDLCAMHLHALVGRRLEVAALTTLARRLLWLGVRPRQVFLLHEGFYDRSGRPLQPVAVCEGP